MTIDLISAVAALEYIAVGFTKMINPDYFWNPADGLLKTVSGVRETELDSNHLDPMLQIITMMEGAGVLSIGMAFLMVKDTMTRKACYSLALYVNLFLFFVYFSAVLNDDNKYLNLPLIGVYAGFFLSNAVWFLKELSPESARDTLKRTPAPWPNVLNLVVQGLNLGLFGLLDMFNPHGHDPDSAMPFWNKTTLSDNTKDDLAIFQSRAQAAIPLAFACSALEVFLFDRSEERIRWYNRCCVAAYIPYLMVFARAALDDSGYAKKEAWVQLVVLQLFFLFSCLVLGRILTPMKRTSFSSKKKKLTTEQNNKYE